VAVAIDIEQVGAFGTLGEERLATDRFEGAHRRIDAAGHEVAGAGEQVVAAAGVEAHGQSGAFRMGCRNRWSEQRVRSARQNRAASRRVAASGSSASNTALMTAIRSAPASINGRALSALMPPIATRGRPSCRLP